MLMQAKLNSRKWASSLVRRHPWAPAAAALAAALGLTATAVKDVRFYWVLGAAVVLMFSSYVWGYSARALKYAHWPSLAHLHRRQYAEVWDALAASPWQAMAAACGKQVESMVRLSAMESINNLLELAAVSSRDEVLEIGCGVGRIGFGLAPHCRMWTGADISGNMLACASDRLRELGNVRLVRLHGDDLDELVSGSFDVVYSTNMFAHLDEMDRWRYVEEAFRVLRLNGRLFIDNVDLESDAGWSMFAEGAKSSQHLERPPYIPRFSTAAELMTYALRAGFARVQSHRRPPLLIVTAIKPSLGRAL